MCHSIVIMMSDAEDVKREVLTAAEKTKKYNQVLCDLAETLTKIKPAIDELDLKFQLYMLQKAKDEKHKNSLEKAEQSLLALDNILIKADKADSAVAVFSKKQLEWIKAEPEIYSKFLEIIGYLTRKSLEEK